MARRRELADVADGLSGHFAAFSDATQDPPLLDIMKAVREGQGQRFVFDLVSGTVEPASVYVNTRARSCRDRLFRHLAARKIRNEWVAEANLTVEIGEWSIGERADVWCRVSVTDDRGFVHTSTRHTRVWIQPYWPLERVVRRLRRIFYRK